MMFKQATFEEPLLFDLGRKGRSGIDIPGEGDRDLAKTIPKKMARQKLQLPEISQVEVVRHFTRLSQMNWGIDIGPYPLGSCTMKYNPRINEDLAWADEAQGIHPLQDIETVQGALEIMYRLERALTTITGMSRFTLQPAAGAQGELTGCLIIRNYHRLRGESRDEIIVPDSAHGTNPASASMAGFKVVEVPTGDDGCINLEMLQAALSDRTAGMMMTNPNTLGIFENRAKKIAELIHGAGGLMYYDGANLQGIVGIVKPGDLGFDLVHLNLHKTFATPHGGGGPGAGPVGVKANLAEFLPVPLVERTRDGYRLEWDRPLSIGKVRGAFGSFPILLRAYAYLLSMGTSGLETSCKVAVLNTNYFAKRISGIKGLTIPFGNAMRKHEVAISAEAMFKKTGINALDIAKALLDRGLHAPTIYFPLIVKECLMFEFTDTETLESIDRYVDALKDISRMAYSEPEKLRASPLRTSVTRLDEVRANHPLTMCLRYRGKRPD
ncbi:MAG: aminomethyl-transferring glycine dehydrogenase subunit GcvPB [Candidatus Methanomethylicus sp.]|nr:aminomethyl-transferring glycine dehydrogenase subunit GcvPB [Candidatus Methanomethylicus sp.]